MIDATGWRQAGLRGTLALAVLLAVAGCSGSEETQVSEAEAPKTFGADTHLVASRPDAILRYAEHPRGFAELRLPKGEGSFPLAVIFHGGCWKTGIATQAYMAPLATRWQQLGIATLNVDYREVGDGGGWPGSFQDWAAVEGLLTKLAKDRRIDLFRLTLVGHSAGGLPAQWLAATQGPDGPVGIRSPAFPTNAIVFDGPADLALDQPSFDALCEFSAVAPFMGGTVKRRGKRYGAISAVKHPPWVERLLFVQAKLPAPHREALAAIRERGVRVEVILKPEASHFDVITPGNQAYDSVEPNVLKILRGQ
jgi:pimeloyl-ACP methyl ester carboxylesterase